MSVEWYHFIAWNKVLGSGFWVNIQRKQQHSTCDIQNNFKPSVTLLCYSCSACAVMFNFVMTSVLKTFTEILEVLASLAGALS
jgi:hypothetical protein